MTNVTIDPEREVVVPKKLIPILREIRWPRNIDLLLDQLTRNPREREAFVQLALELSCDGLKTFRTILKTNPQMLNKQAPSQILKRVLIIQDLKERKYQLHSKAASRLAFSLSNGLPCEMTLIKALPFGLEYYHVTLTIDNVKATLYLNDSQALTFFEQATKDIHILKRMKPHRIAYEIGGRTVDLPEEYYKAAMLAISEKTSLMIAPLLSAKET
jgi:hypothetical protein